MTPEAKVRENRLRRAAERQAVFVHKSRRRDPRALDYDSYWLLDVETEAVVAGGKYGFTIDELEAELTKPRVTKT